MGYPYEAHPSPGCLVDTTTTDGWGKANSKRDRHVHFEENENQTFLIQRVPRGSLWYDGSDYNSFASDFKEHKRNISLKKRDKSLADEDDGDEVPKPEDYESDLQQARLSRRSLVQTLLSHQASCRAMGYSDYDGCSLLLESMSKKDRDNAFHLAVATAYEVECVLGDPTESKFSTLCIEYYLESLYPYMHNSMLTLSRVLTCGHDV